jgi:hypothetical protein
MKRSVLFAVVAGTVLFVNVPAMAAAFEEVNGVVSFEAENSTSGSGWTNKSFSNASGTIMEDNGSGTLSYLITFHKTGRYIFWVRHAKETPGVNGCAADQCNDCFATMDDHELFMHQGTSCAGSEVFGFGTHETSLTWQSRPKTECSDDRSKNVATDISTAGVHTFKLSHRSTFYRIDKIVIKHIDNGGLIAPSGMGPAETILGTTAARQGINRIPGAISLQDQEHVSVYNIKGTRVFFGTGSDWLQVQKQLRPGGSGMFVVRAANGPAAMMVR